MEPGSRNPRSSRPGSPTAPPPPEPQVSLSQIHLREDTCFLHVNISAALAARDGLVLTAAPFPRPGRWHHPSPSASLRCKLTTRKEPSGTWPMAHALLCCVDTCLPPSRCGSSSPSRDKVSYPFLNTFFWEWVIRGQVWKCKAMTVFPFVSPMCPCSFPK